MPHITKSTLSFATTALTTAENALPPYSHPKSPHKFTQPQLFAVLALRVFLKQDYRGITSLMSEWAELRQALKLKKVPHYSALCYAEQRLVKKGVSMSSLIAVSNSPENAVCSESAQSISRLIQPVTTQGTLQLTTVSAAV